MNWQKDLSLLLLRLGAGGLMIPHGWSKLKRLRTGLAEGEVKFYDWMGLGEDVSLGLAVFGELVAPAFIVLGLWTRWMSVPAAITMAVAAFVVHSGDPISDKEHALLFFIPFVVLGLMGGGKYSVDRRIGRPK
ncbi:MAG: DoxX family protein [Crocinitomicaceae bacterium]|nr:DoxX family protein [Crocinitomicaceae bacterium]